MSFKHPLNSVFSNYDTMIFKFIECYKLEEGCGERSFLLITKNFLDHFWA